MSRVETTPVELVRNTAVDAKAATVMDAIVHASGSEIDVSNINTDKLIIHVKNTHSSAHEVTIKAGDYSRSSLGDYTFEVPLTSGEAMVVIESARFKNADGKILVDFDAGTTGFIGAYLLP